MLQARFRLRDSHHISERFDKSPNIEKQMQTGASLEICHADQDALIIQNVKEMCLKAYSYTKEWFGHPDDLAMNLWLAPDIVDFQYMTCLECDEGFFCAPGNHQGKKVILCLTPRAYRQKPSKERFTAGLAHEIAHHFIRKISGATVLTMNRKQNHDLPMWLEEGLCQVIQSELDPIFQQRLDEETKKIRQWDKLNDLWNDLSSCKDVKKAYLQAYNATKTLMVGIGKLGAIKLLFLNAKKGVDWIDVMDHNIVLRYIRSL